MGPCSQVCRDGRLVPGAIARRVRNGQWWAGSQCSKMQAQSGCWVALRYLGIAHISSHLAHGPSAVLLTARGVSMSITLPSCLCLSRRVLHALARRALAQIRLWVVFRRTAKLILVYGVYRELRPALFISSSLIALPLLPLFSLGFRRME